MPALTVRDLEVRFPGLERPALAIPMLDLNAGERVVLTGPSGSGKTTLLNILTGLERAGVGSVVWQETDIAQLNEGPRDKWRAA
ncbi:MAG TPA: ATP-binding cassette domain-containing protein, partial [Ancylobacter sp.]